jgi:hypothetical protein
MANSPAITDYTNRDYESLLRSLLDQAALKLPEWTDRSENDLGRLLLESFAYVGDVLLYYQDRIANEAFLSTAVERRSVIDLLSLIGYTLATPAPASVDLRITVTDTDIDTVQIGEPDQGVAWFATQATPGHPAIEFIYLPITGQPLVQQRREVGQPFSFSIPVINASRITNEELGDSSGEPNQSFKLNGRPVLLPRIPDEAHYLQVETVSGETAEAQRWYRRESLFNSYSKDPHYIVKINERDEAEIIFGDGRYGAIPPEGDTIRATYLIGGGVDGNVGPNTITQVTRGVSVAAVQVTNPKAATGGADRESIDYARRHAPQVYRSLKRAVTEADYVALAESFPGVLKAAAETPSWNYVDIYVVTTGNLELTDDLRARLIQFFEDKRMVSTLVQIRQPVLVSVQIVIGELGIAPTYYQDDVVPRVKAALSELFRLDRLSFGQSIYLSKFYEAVENLPGVDYVRAIQFEGMCSRPAGQRVHPDEGLLQLKTKEFPRLSNGIEFYDLTLISLDTATALPQRGESLVVVAKIDDFYHVRIFDRTGERIIDRGNGEFRPDATLVQQLEDGLHRPTLDSATKRDLIQKIASNLGYPQLGQDEGIVIRSVVGGLGDAGGLLS